MMSTRLFLSGVATGLLTIPAAMAQDPLVIPQKTPGTTQAVATATAAPADGKVRVFVAESDSWSASSNSGSAFGAFGSLLGAAASHSSAGARPQTAEIMKTIGQKCPQLIVNNRQEMSDYVIRLEHEGGKGPLSHKNKVVVFARRSGDSIFSHSTLSLGGSVEGACAAIGQHWASHEQALAAIPDSAAPKAVAASPAAPTSASLTVEANAAGADVDVDGEFMGNAPSTLSLAPGKHTITVKKAGYTEWSRTMMVSGSSVHVRAEMATEAGPVAAANLHAQK